MESHEEPRHDPFHMGEWEIELRVLTPLDALPLRVVGPQRQLAFDCVDDLKLRRVEVAVRPDYPMPELTEYTSRDWHKHLQLLGRSGTSPKRILGKQRDQCGVHSEKEGIGFLAPLTDSVGHFKVGLINLERMIPIRGNILIRCDAL